MSLATLLRSEIDRLLRPGQARTAVLAHRTLSGEGLRSGNVALLNHFDLEEGANMRSAVYGRARYGSGRYALTHSS